METFYDLLVTVVRLFSTIVVIILFFLFVVRPLLDYLIMNREIEHRKRMSDDILDEVAPLADLGVGRGGDGEEAKVPASADFVVQRPGGGLSEQEKLSRLATSSPDKAGELVKQWINNDSGR